MSIGTRSCSEMPESPVAGMGEGERPSLREAPGPVTTIGAPCPNSSESDDSTQVCALERLVPGHHYAIGVTRDGADCAGACSYNRYVLNLSLQTP